MVEKSFATILGQSRSDMRASAIAFSAWAKHAGLPLFAVKYFSKLARVRDLTSGAIVVTEAVPGVYVHRPSRNQKCSLQ